MPIQVLLNIFIAYLWMFLQDETSIINFIGGYIAGLFILFCIRRFFNKPFYLFTLAAVGKLFVIFIYELVISSMMVMKHVLRPKVDVKPGIFKVETDLEGDLEVTLLSLLICLTPGSVVMEITPDAKTLYIHGLNMPESKESVLKSKSVFEKAIKDVTRK
ncbi:Na+/H+ antiporter subunit E [Paenibacillus phoenicis]|jgi:multicomponent Na+:H+ antiporter subunit E|uniref:Na+/H+ antiporter subunit E n=1 Tax=Paenibacillus phoenicis TaxID=554117 RepID=A0ABU5PR40_9BACL|nr:MULTISPECIES: Na+/H+ antiporter subunit E [Paenibacillus]MEA3572059.1 Na+/H+ antiporter subunit E [Paenibacillus phoenicis]SMF00272.1 multisubunit sodium/proton antiporter, MrpE subunit (TC 2.A.63.1) [Paenibacillus barengoltzii]